MRLSELDGLTGFLLMILIQVAPFGESPRFVGIYYFPITWTPKVWKIMAF